MYASSNPIQGQSAASQAKSEIPSTIAIAPHQRLTGQRGFSPPRILALRQSPLLVQPKLTIGAPDDKYEQEADRMADRIMRMPEPSIQLEPGGPFTYGPSDGDREDENGIIQTKPIALYGLTELQRQPLEEEEEEEELLQPKSLNDRSPIYLEQQPFEEEDEELLQTKPLAARIMFLVQRQIEEEPLSANPGAKPSYMFGAGVKATIQSMKGRGQPLSRSARSYFEPKFGHDFGQVRIHSDAHSDSLSRSVNASAFTVGNDIFFRQGQYNPASSVGKRLLAHELTHTVQQRGLGAPLPSAIQRQENPECRTKESACADILTPLAGFVTDEPPANVEEFYRLVLLNVSPATLLIFLPPPFSMIALPLYLAAIFVKTIIKKLGLAELKGIWDSLPFEAKAEAINKLIDKWLVDIPNLKEVPPVNEYVKIGLIAFLEKLKLVEDQQKVMIAEKLGTILAGQDLGFFWGAMKGLYVGFLVEGFTGLFQMVIDISCILPKIDEAICYIRESFTELTDELQEALQAYEELKQAVYEAMQNAPEELLALLQKAENIGQILALIKEKLKEAPAAIGEAGADLLVLVGETPPNKIGFVVGKTIGLSLWEVILTAVSTALTSYIGGIGGAASALVSLGKQVLAQLVKAIGKIHKFILPVINFIGRHIFKIMKFLEGINALFSSSEAFSAGLKIRLVLSRIPILMRSVLNLMDEFAWRLRKRNRRDRGEDEDDDDSEEGKLWFKFKRIIEREIKVLKEEGDLMEEGTEDWKGVEVTAARKKVKPYIETSSKYHKVVDTVKIDEEPHENKPYLWKFTVKRKDKNGNWSDDKLLKDIKKRYEEIQPAIVDKFKDIDDSNIIPENMDKHIDDEVEELKRKYEYNAVEVVKSRNADNKIIKWEIQVSYGTETKTVRTINPIEDPLTMATAKTIPGLERRLDQRPVHSSENLSLNDGSSAEVGTYMLAEYHTRECGKGSEADGQDNLYGFGKLPLIGAFGSGHKADTIFIRGHLLNYSPTKSLGGPGEPRNLFPITGQANKDHERSVESHVKDLVHDPPFPVVRYEVSVTNFDKTRDIKNIAIPLAGGHTCAYQYIEKTDFDCTCQTYKLKSDGNVERKTPASPFPSTLPPIESRFNEELFRGQVAGPPEKCPQRRP